MVELFKIQDIHVSSLLFRCKVDNLCLLVHQLFIFEYQCYNLIFSPLKMTPHKAQCAFLCAFIMSACIINYSLCIVHYAPCIFHCTLCTMHYASYMCKLINNIDWNRTDTPQDQIYICFFVYKCIYYALSIMYYAISIMHCA